MKSSKTKLIIAFLLLFGVFLICRVIFYSPKSYKVPTNYEPQIDYESVKIDREDPDFKILMETSSFLMSGESFTYPDEYKSLHELLQKEDALNYLYILEKEATNEGKLYALCAIYYLDYNYYRYLMEHYVLSEETVIYADREYLMIKIIKRDGKKIVRLRNNKDTVTKWTRRHFTNTVPLDFYGGGFPYLIIQQELKHFE